MEKKIYLVYKTTHETLKAESMLRDLMIRVRPVMKPVKIKSSCGMALEIGSEHRQSIEVINREGDFTFIGFYQKAEEGWEKLEE